MAKGNYYTPLGNGLWRDERTGAVGTLKVGRGGGFYVDADDQSGTSREKFKKEQISQAYRDADDKVASFYRRKNKEGQLKSSSKEEDVREAKEEANEKLAEAVEFGNLYNSPLQPLPGEYDINEFTKVDENAKTRMDRFAERNRIAENLKKWGEEEYDIENVFIPDRDVIEDKYGNTYINNDEYARQLNAEDMKGMGKRYFSSEEKVEGYQRRKGITQAVDDKAIENDIKSLFIYQNEPTMGTLEKEPMKRYYDKYGKENVDRVWGNLDEKYAVIQGTSMDYEGLRYNQLVEKDKYSPEAIDYYRKQVENAWQNHSWDTKKYNEATKKAKEEFERFDSERSSWEKEDTEIPTLDEEVRNLVKQNYGEIDMNDLYDEELDAITKVAQDNIKEMKTTKKVSKEDTEDYRVKMLNDDKIRISDKYESPNGVPLKVLAKDVSDRYIVNEAGNEYRATEDELRGILNEGQYSKVEYQGVKKENTTEEKWTDTDKYEYDLYKRSKENPDSIDPMTENSTDWDALDKKWSNRYDYDKEQEEYLSNKNDDYYNKLTDKQKLIVDEAKRKGVEEYNAEVAEGKNRAEQAIEAFKERKEKVQSKYEEYYKKEGLGTPSNYQEGDKIEFDNGYYSTLKGKILREATEHEKKYTMNSNIKGYMVRDENGFEYVVPDTRIKNKVEAKVERFKERKGKDLGVNITEAPTRATKTPKPIETYTKSGKINYKAFGITRTPESDFSDDGTRFSAYMLDNGMRMTVAKSGGDTFMSVDSPYHKEVSYEEYSSLPHYKDLDMYNGVSTGVDLNRLVGSANAYMNEYNELLKSKGIPVDNRSVLMRRTDNFVDAIDSANESYNYHKDYYKNHPGEYSHWRYHDNEARKAKNRAEKLQQKMDNFISESTKEKPAVREYNNYKKTKFASSKIDNIKAQVERYKKRKNK